MYEENIHVVIEVSPVFYVFKIKYNIKLAERGRERERVVTRRDRKLKKNKGKILNAGNYYRARSETETV